MIAMPPGDVADRLSIMTLKMERLMHIDPDYDDYIKEVRMLGISKDVERLYDVNKNIWDLEFDIRHGNGEQLGLKEVGRRALIIQEFNKIRVEIKNSINNRFNRPVEVKGQHASA